MLERFGSRCAFTGIQPGAALDASHLYRYASDPKHDLRGGLLLRRDLHTLFDRLLVAVDPQSWTIRVAPTLMSYPELASLEGKPVQIDSQLRPATNYIEAHFKAAKEAWAMVINEAPSRPERPIAP